MTGGRISRAGPASNYIFLQMLKEILVIISIMKMMNIVKKNYNCRECDELLDHRAYLEGELDQLRQIRHAAECQAELATAREKNALMV